MATETCNIETAVIRWNAAWGRIMAAVEAVAAVEPGTGKMVKAINGCVKDAVHSPEEEGDSVSTAQMDEYMDAALTAADAVRGMAAGIAENPGPGRALVAALRGLDRAYVDSVEKMQDRADAYCGSRCGNCHG